MHPPRVTVWCRLAPISPIMKSLYLTNSSWLELDGMHVDNIWFQQNGAIYHIAAETMQIMQTKFLGRITSHQGEVNWPPRSGDLTLLDFSEGKRVCKYRPFLRSRQKFNVLLTKSSRNCD